MSQGLRQASGWRRVPLDARWSLCRVAPDAVCDPRDLPAVAEGSWIDCPGADTVAGALRAAGRWSLDESLRRWDADDWWFRAVFDAPDDHGDRQLAFDGLAGLCEVWLNGRPLLSSDNMHLAHRCAVPALRATDNELLMRFRSIDRWLQTRRPRPRWRTPMVQHQQLRWLRSSLLGRTPGWSPPAAAVGPWRGVDWIERGPVEASGLRLRAWVAGADGIVDIGIDLIGAPAFEIEHVELQVMRGDAVWRCELARPPRSTLPRFKARLRIPQVALWWPHTHGEAALHEARVRITPRGAVEPVMLELGRLGFRTVTVDTRDGDFALGVNGVPVFCRGACWTPLDIVGLKAGASQVHAAIEQVRGAGMNMLRVSGSMVYEDEAFLDACDAHGVLVWHDFMFANMDFPADDPAFAASVRQEAEQQLDRWQAHACLAVVCGNSEVGQQAAMWGGARDTWTAPLFEHDLAELARSRCPDAVYRPSSAHGGAFPHQNDRGTTSYYGVGAYLRPLEDARRSGLRFATECLAFANVPPPSTLARMPGGAALRCHHAGWKARSPRDLGAGWDFDDVRDHYLQRLYRVDPVSLRSSDHERYLAMSRATGAEVMAAAFGEWRRPGSGCRGALVWFLRDLWAGAGWGLLDDQGWPKAAFHGCRRALAPVSVFLSDEGTNGLQLHVVNDPAAPLNARIDIALYRDDGLLLQRAEQAHEVALHGALSLPVAQWFDHFIDLSRAYRFGPAEHALVVATLRDDSGCMRAQAFHCPEGLPSERRRDVGLGVDGTLLHDDGSATVTLSTRGFAQSVHFEVDGFAAEDEYFHLAPGQRRDVRLVPMTAAPGRPPRGSVLALNAWSGASLGAAS